MALHRILFLTTVLCCLLSGLGSGQDLGRVTPETLQGLWLLDTDLQLEKALLSDRNATKKLKKEHLEHQKRSLNSRYYSFGRDGKFTAFWSTRGDARTAYGKWELSKDGELYISMDDGASIVYSLVSNKNFLFLKPSRKGGQPLHLKRFEP